MTTPTTDEVERRKVGYAAYTDSLIGIEDAEIARSMKLEEAYVTECRKEYLASRSVPSQSEAQKVAIARVERERRAKEAALTFLNQTVCRYEIYCMGDEPKIPHAEQIRLATVLYKCYLDAVKLGLDIDARYAKYFPIESAQKFEFTETASPVDRAIEELSREHGAAAEEDSPL